LFFAVTKVELLCCMCMCGVDLRYAHAAMTPHILCPKRQPQPQPNAQAKDKDGLTAAQRKERDAKALQEKLAKKQGAGGEGALTGRAAAASVCLCGTSRVRS
jgi:hypothetical protein